jgi:hypothetical protein
VTPAGDARKITQDYPYVQPKSMLDLSFLARVVDPENCGNVNVLISLARLTRGYIGNDLNKDNSVRKSDWSLSLDSEQQECQSESIAKCRGRWLIRRATFADAANDVVVSMSIYRKLLQLAGERRVQVDRDLICQPPAPAPTPANDTASYWARRKSWGKK